MNQNDFMRQQQAAVERMREMNARAQINRDTGHKMPPVPSFVRVNENSTPQRQSTQARQNPTSGMPQKSSHGSSAPTAAPQSLTQNNSFNSGLNIPFLDSVLKDGDSTLIIGLLLILMSENADKMLMFALIYILL